MLGEDNKFNVVAEFISAYWIASADEVSLAMTEGVVIASPDLSGRGNLRELEGEDKPRHYTIVIAST